MSITQGSAEESTAIKKYYEANRERFAGDYGKAQRYFRADHNGGSVGAGGGAPKGASDDRQIIAERLVAEGRYPTVEAALKAMDRFEDVQRRARFVDSFPDSPGLSGR